METFKGGGENTPGKPRSVEEGPAKRVLDEPPRTAASLPTSRSCILEVAENGASGKKGLLDTGEVNAAVETPRSYDTEKGQQGNSREGLTAQPTRAQVAVG